MDVNLKTLICTSVLLFFTSGVILNGEIVQEKSCSVNVTEGLIVAMKDSRKEANAFVNASLNVSSKSECLHSCCMEEMCSIYMFLEDLSYRKKLHYNCFLVNCNPPDKCKYRPLPGCEVGIKLTSPITTSSTEQSQMTSTVPTIQETAKTNPITEQITYSQASKPSVPLTTVPNPSAELNNTIPLVNQNQAEIKVATEALSQQDTALDLNSVVPSLSSDQNKAIMSSSSIQENTSPTTKPTETSPKDSFPFVGSSNNHNFDSNHGHTNTASLVIALIFGIVFLTASMVLLGRRWWESFRKRRAFSKVDYLLNGI